MLRAGHIHVSQADALYDASLGKTYSISMGSLYLGAELSGGKLFKSDDGSTLDLYGRSGLLRQDSAACYRILGILIFKD